MPSQDDPRRVAVRSWLAEHPTPTGRELAEAGYVAPHWPSPWGLDADPIHQLIIDEELRPRRCAGPTTRSASAGPDRHPGPRRHEEQKDRYLFPLLCGRGHLVPALQRTRRGERPRRRSARGRCETATSGSSTARRSGLGSAGEPVRHPDRAHRPRRGEAPGHLVLHLPDGHARHRGPSDTRDDRRRDLQRGVLHRRAHPRRRPGRRGEPGLGPGQGDARQRARLAVEAAARCGAWVPTRRTCWRSCASAGAAPIRSCARSSPRSTSSRRSCA
jgi:hypothetical protein